MQDIIKLTQDLKTITENSEKIRIEIQSLVNATNCANKATELIGYLIQLGEICAKLEQEYDDSKNTAKVNYATEFLKAKKSSIDGKNVTDGVATAMAEEKLNMDYGYISSSKALSSQSENIKDAIKELIMIAKLKANILLEELNHLGK